ncbi:hypothetical protein [Sphingopyxis sp. PET50]|uniref:hypothetical protein n=1 Tax=Sphingopyxis sp. PET50 TaxID=2976533 RepID=UPI0021AE4B77|nr:hypothetical protein [Sphingopyxis sp. PET50]
MNRIAIAVLGLSAALALPAAAQEPAPTPAEAAQLELLAQPESWFVEQLGGQRRTIDGQTLDAKIHYALELAARAPRPGGPPVDPGATVEGRAAMRAAADRSWTFRTKVTAPMADVLDRSVPGRGGAIPVRVYRPAGEGPFPVLVYFHGGGWLTGSIA